MAVRRARESNTITTTVYLPRFRGDALLVRRFLSRAFRELRITNSALQIAFLPSGILDTNVLSYSAPSSFSFGKNHQRMLGDLYLNPDYIQKHHEDILYMALHGLLHLLGHDHEGRDERMRMESLEKKILTALSRQKR